MLIQMSVVEVHALKASLQLIKDLFFFNPFIQPDEL